MGFPTSH